MKVSVIIPALNEQTRIGDCLASLENQSFSKEYEVIVVDNGSSDRTCEIVKQSAARLLQQPRRSAYLARNLAIEHSSGEYLAFTDADCVAHCDWLAQFVACAESNQAWIAGGATRYDLLTDNLGNRLLVETHQPDQLRSTIEQYHCVAGGNMLVKRSAFLQYGLFKAIRSGSDIEFSRRLAAAGHPAVFAEKAIVRHQCDLTNWDYLRRCYRIRCGQRVHSRRKQGWAAAFAHLRHLPWRPGFRAVGGGKSIAALGTSKGFVREWSYRWATRWAAFLGDLHGYLQTAAAER